METRDCIQCGEECEPDPDGGEGVWVHSGDERFDRDEDHAPIPALKTEINTPEMSERVRNAFLKSDYAGDAEVYDSNIVTAFEHDNWWIHDKLTGAAWCVVDAEGKGAIDGFDFERVSEGDDG